MIYNDSTQAGTQENDSLEKGGTLPTIVKK